MALSEKNSASDKIISNRVVETAFYVSKEIVWGFFFQKDCFFSIFHESGRKTLASGKKVYCAGLSKVQSLCLRPFFKEKLYLWKKFSAFSIDGHWATKKTCMLANFFGRVVKGGIIPIHRIILRRKFLNGIKFSASSLHIERKFSGFLSKNIGKLVKSASYVSAKAC